MFGQSLEPRRRIAQIKIVLPLAFICGLLLSMRLWLSARAYPLSPVADGLPVVPFPFDYILFILLLGLLILIVMVRRPRVYIVIFLALAVYVCLTDQTRWQPWVYQYLFMLAAMAFYSWEDSDIEGQRVLLNTCRLIVASIYIWSGIQKIDFTVPSR